MTRLCMRYESSMYVTWLIHMCDITRMFWHCPVSENASMLRKIRTYTIQFEHTLYNFQIARTMYIPIKYKVAKIQRTVDLQVSFYESINNYRADLRQEICKIRHLLSLRHHVTYIVCYSSWSNSLLIVKPAAKQKWPRTWHGNPNSRSILIFFQGTFEL